MGVSNRTVTWRVVTGIKITHPVSSFFFWGDVTGISKKTRGGKVLDWLFEQRAGNPCLREVTVLVTFCGNWVFKETENNLVKAASVLLCYCHPGTGDELRDCTGSCPKKERGTLYWIVCVGEVQLFAELDFTFVKQRCQ